MNPLDPELLDIVERCVIAFERDGEQALEAEFAAAGSHASMARAHIGVLQAQGLLQAPETPTHIGPWRVLQRLGGGGMGTVYLGEQGEPLRRRAAIKVIRRGMDSSEILARFAIEQKALLMLDHPGIARILDAGKTNDGRPFFAMDYVKGLPLLRYCDERQLDTLQRLRLFAQVCDAVQHAHHKGLLHRDLKQSNILVADRDGHALPVVIDFGVAKSVGGSLAAATQLTLPGRLLGTPEYMSPEQATNEADVDTRTDVYSLGVILYELLTGLLPFDAKVLRGDVARFLRESDPATPSTRLTALGERATVVASMRQTNPASLRRALRGDLDSIVMKALDRDRNRRYGMPAEFAADISRHLASEPITAGAPSPWLRLRKYCARHRLQVSSAAIVAAALTGGLATSLSFYRQTKQSERAATASLDDALRAVGELVQVGDSDLVAVPHLEHVRRDLLERAVAFYRGFLARQRTDDPRLLAGTVDATFRLGKIELALGSSDDARRQFELIESLLQQPGAAQLDPRLRLRVEAGALLERANIASRQAEDATSLALVSRALPIARELARGEPAAPQDRQLLVATLNLAGNLQNDTPTTSMALLDEAFALTQQLHEQAPSAQTLATLIAVGADRAYLLVRTGRRAECLATLAPLQQLLQQAPDPAAWPLPNAAFRLLRILHQCERPDAVLELVEDTIGGVERLVHDHPSILAYRSRLIDLWTMRGNAQLMRHDVDAARAAQERVRAECEAGLALAPLDRHLRRELVVSGVNGARIENRRRQMSGTWDPQWARAGLERARTILEALPEGEARRQNRPQRLEMLLESGALNSALGDLTKADQDLAEATTLAEQLVAEAPATVEYETRLNEALNRRAEVLVAAGRGGDAVLVLDRAMAISDRLKDKADARVRWHDRRRELLLLLLRARGLAGDIDGALATLEEHARLGTELDWIGRQMAAEAVALLLAALPATADGRERLLARGRELIAEGLSFEARQWQQGNSRSMTAVMRANTLVIARRIEQAVDDLHAANRCAREAVEAYAEAWQARPSERGERRVSNAGADWLATATATGVAALLDEACERLQALLAERPDRLADLAAAGASLANGRRDDDLAIQLRSRSITLLRAGIAAGLASDALQSARFDALRTVAEFTALGGQEPR